MHALPRLAVEDVQTLVVRAGDEPAALRDKTHCAHWLVVHLKSFDECFGLVIVRGDVPDVHLAVVEAERCPRFGRMQVAALDARRFRFQCDFQVHFSGVFNKNYLESGTLC